MPDIPDVDDVIADLSKHADGEQAAFLLRFFKTGPGEYGEGDVFLGIRVPVIRRLAKQNRALPLSSVKILLRSRYHEQRALALCIMVLQAERADDTVRKALYDVYLGNTRHINNWDLVDVSAPQIVGRYLRDRSRAPLDRLAASTSLWERRIAILATFDFIRRGEFADTLRIAEKLLADREDLIHKATGWLLREVGKRDRAAEEVFLKNHCRTMPRTMLRYAIERFPEALRRKYMAGLPD